MESVSLILIMVGAVIIGVVLLLRVGLNRKEPADTAMPLQGQDATVRKEPEFDPLFAIDALKETDTERQAEPTGDGEVVPQAAVAEPVSTAPQEPASYAVPPAPRIKRRPPRVADDPNRVVALNVMAGQGKMFSGPAIHEAAVSAGLEYGDWQIFHYYSPHSIDAPPMFSVANMVKPGNFDLARLEELNTAGLSLFMVPAGDGEDITAFNTMLATARQLAETLGGDVRDARRSVLTRQAVNHIREQLNEWRHKAQAVQY